MGGEALSRDRAVEPERCRPRLQAGGACRRARRRTAEAQRWGRGRRLAPGPRLAPESADCRRAAAADTAAPAQPPPASQRPGSEARRQSGPVPGGVRAWNATPTHASGTGLHIRTCAKANNDSLAPSESVFGVWHEERTYTFSYCMSSLVGVTSLFQKPVSRPRGQDRGQGCFTGRPGGGVGDRPPYHHGTA